ncbi:MAG: hypothetical protein VZT48_12960 [Bulleidia sp.]|nr:hypothetical protein [Bulleidia sp.]
MTVVDELITLLRLLFRRLVIVILVIKISEMRITVCKPDDEVVVGSGRRRRPGADEILQELVVLHIDSPVVRRNVAKVLHKDEGTDENSRINGRPAGVRVQRQEDVRSELWLKLGKLVKSNLELLLRETLKRIERKIFFLESKPIAIFID